MLLDSVEPATSHLIGVANDRQVPASLSAEPKVASRFHFGRWPAATSRPGGLEQSLSTTDQLLDAQPKHLMPTRLSAFKAASTKAVTIASAQ